MREGNDTSSAVHDSEPIIDVFDSLRTVDEAFAFNDERPEQPTVFWYYRPAAIRARQRAEERMPRKK